METIKWTVDPNQSKITFSVKKLMVTTVEGNFKAFKGGLETESENFESLKNIRFLASIDSLKTDDEKRDEHLKSADFFDIDTYPLLSFKADRYTIKDPKMEGELTIRDITRPVVLDVEFSGTPGNGNRDISSVLLLSGKVKREDFGLSWSGKNQAGDIIVGDEIKLKAQVSFIKQPAEVEEARNVLA